MTRKLRLPLLLRSGGLVVAAAIALFPIYWMVTLSTQSEGQVVGQHLRLLPTLNGFGGISHLGATDVAIWLANSALVSIGTAALSIVFAVFPAYGLSRYRFRGAEAFGFAVFATQMLPPALLVVPLYVIFSRLGLINNLLSLVLADAAFAMPIALWIIKGAMDAIPRELDEAANMDGASSLSVLRKVVLPLTAPAVASAGIIAFFFAWNDFLFANTFMIDQNRWTVTKGLASLFGQYSTPIPFIMASAVLFSIPPVLFFLLLQRRIVSGLTAGAVKG